MDKYERLHKIGEGAYGEVFKCVHRASGDPVAIKRFTDSDEDPNIRKMCTRELGMLKVCTYTSSGHPEMRITGHICCPKHRTIINQDSSLIRTLGSVPSD